MIPRIDWSKLPPLDPKPVAPVKDRSRVWGATGWEDQSGQCYEDGSWPWAGLPAWRPDTKRHTY